MNWLINDVCLEIRDIGIDLRAKGNDSGQTARKHIIMTYSHEPSLFVYDMA